MFLSLSRWGQFQEGKEHVVVIEACKYQIVQSLNLCFISY
jgi:hypothetical protein